MKNKTKETKQTKTRPTKIKNIKSAIQEQEYKSIDKHGYPIPRSELCFKCEEVFYLTFVVAKRDYDSKNF